MTVRKIMITGGFSMLDVVCWRVLRWRMSDWIYMENINPGL